MQPHLLLGFRCSPLGPENELLRPQLSYVLTYEPITVQRNTHLPLTSPESTTHLENGVSSTLWSMSGASWYLVGH